jgi:type VI protein secretion system component VasK
MNLNSLAFERSGQATAGRFPFERGSAIDVSLAREPEVPRALQRSG